MLMTTKRSKAVFPGALLLSVIVASLAYGAGPLVAAAAGERADAGTRRFRGPVELQSFAPIRTVGNEASGEPTIAVDDAGTIFVAGTYGVGAASPVWWSKDGGETFSELQTPGHAREYFAGAEGDVAVDDAGHVYFADTFLAGVLLTRWSGSGETWESTGPVVENAPAVFDRPWLDWSREGLFLYLNFGSVVQVFRSTDEGATWTSPGPLRWRGSAEGQPYFPGHMSVARDTGNVVVAGMIRDYDANEVFLAATYSSDGGATCRESIVAPWPSSPGSGISPIFPGMTAIDDAGTAYVTWSEFHGRGCSVYYSSSADEGRSWTDPVRLDAGRGCATFPTLDALPGGRLAAAWYATPFHEELAGGPPSSTPGDYAARYGGFALPVQTYQDDVEDSAEWFVDAAFVSRAASRRPRVVRGRATPEPILQGPLQRRLIDFFEIALDRRGRAHIAFAEDADGDGTPHSWYVGSRKSYFETREGR